MTLNLSNLHVCHHLKVPPDLKPTKVNQTKKKNILIKTDQTNETIPDDTSVSNPEGTCSTECNFTSNYSLISLIFYSLVNEVAVGSFYDPNLLPDHRGDYFKHVNAKLVQLDIRNEENNLIPPWDMYDKLRPGTIVLVDASLVCWHIFTKGRGDHLDRKVRILKFINFYLLSN